MSGSPGSLQIVFDEVKGQLDAQAARVDTLDGKSNFGLASASLLTAGLISFQDAVPIAEVSTTVKMVYWVLVISALITYVIVVVTAYYAYRVLPFKAVPAPKRLLEGYLNKPEEDTKRALVTAFVEAFDQNEKLVQRKTQWTTAVLISLMVEAALLLIITIVQLSV
jgi:uncharacterized protein HemY